MIISRIRANIGMVVGTVLLVALVAVVLRFNQYGKAVAQAAFQTSRLDLVSRARLALASASEAEKSAVMAVTDEDSQVFAARRTRQRRKPRTRAASCSACCNKVARRAKRISSISSHTALLTLSMSTVICSPWRSRTPI